MQAASDWPNGINLNCCQSDAARGVEPFHGGGGGGGVLNGIF